MTSIHLQSHCVVAPGETSSSNSRGPRACTALAGASHWFDASHWLPGTRQRYWNDASRYVLAAANRCGASSSERPERLALCVGTTVADFSVRSAVDHAVIVDGGQSLNAISAPNISANIAATQAAIALQARAFCSTFTSPFLGGFEALWFGAQGIDAGYADSAIIVAADEILPDGVDFGVLPGAVALRIERASPAQRGRDIAPLCWGHASTSTALVQRLTQCLARSGTTPPRRITVIAEADDVMAADVADQLAEHCGASAKVARCNGPGAVPPLLCALPSLLGAESVLLLGIHEYRYLAFLCITSTPSHHSQEHAMTSSERAETIKQIVSEILEIEPSEMTATSKFKEDHDADSLRAIEILACLEKAFGVVIAQDALARMVNLKGVCEVVDEAVAKKA